MVFVTAGVFVNGDQVLLAQRKKGDKFGLKWEFPGGKIVDGETPEKCLKRELLEEFQVEVEVGSFLMESMFDYGDIQVDLLVYWIDSYHGKFIMNSHERISWVSVIDLNKYNLLEADRPIAQRLLRDWDVLRLHSQKVR